MGAHSSESWIGGQEPRKWSRRGLGAQKIVLGSRGSELACAQTAMAAGALRRAWPELEIKIEVIKTSGDQRSQDTQLKSDPRAGRKGLFTGEIERVLLAGGIDVAVHSAKDLPSDATGGLEVRSALPRAAVEDVLVQRVPAGLAALGQNVIVGTGSARRRCQLGWKHPGIQIVDLWGNVPTRLRKLATNGCDAIVLARAGLERLEYNLASGSFTFEDVLLHAEILGRDEFIPAGGQGVIAIQLRSDDERTQALVDRINHVATLSCLRAEREFLRLLQCDCNSPVGVLATLEHDQMTIGAQVFGALNEPPKTGTVVSSLRTHEPEAISKALYDWMHEQG